MFFFQLPDVPERLLAAHGYKLLKQLTFRQSRRGTFPPREIAQYVEAIAKPGALTGALSWYRAMFRGSPPARGWPRIAAPTLVIWGTADHFLGRSLTRGMRRHFSGPFTIRYLPGVSHWVQQEVPATVTRLLLKFLRAP